MNLIYATVDKIKDLLEVDPQVTTVTFGNLFDLDLNKQTLFPLSHIQLNNSTIEEKVIRLNFSIFLCDLVDVSKDNPKNEEDPFRGNSNLQDVLNTQFTVANILANKLRRGTAYDEGYQLTGDPFLEPFYERFDNLLAGWALTIDVLVPNDVSIC
jgi:hypothetical protein